MRDHREGAELGLGTEVGMGLREIQLTRWRHSVSFWIKPYLIPIMAFPTKKSLIFLLFVV